VRVIPVRGRLHVTITAGRSDATPINRLRELRIGEARNAVIEVNGQSVGQGAVVPIVDGGQPFIFFVGRRAAGAVQVPLTVVDDCGPWPTFVGGGPTAF